MIKKRYFFLLTGLFYFMAGIFGVLPAQTLIPPFENSRFDTINGIMVHSRTWNQGQHDPMKKLVFIHGLAGSTFCFRTLFDTLAATGWMVVALDIPGAGYSDRTLDFNQSHGSRARFLWDVLTVLEPTDTANWTLVGHSMGGGTAEAMAIMKPDRTRQLVLIAGAVFRKSNNLGSTVMLPVRQKVVKKFMVSYADKNIITYKRFYKMLKSAYKRLPDSTEVMGYLTPLLADGSAEALINIYVNNREKEELDVRSLTKIPVLAIWGTKDSWVPLRSVKLALKAFPDLHLIMIKGAGHMVMETHPDQFIPPFLDFIEE